MYLLMIQVRNRYKTRMVTGACHSTCHMLCNIAVEGEKKQIGGKFGGGGGGGGTCLFQF